METKPKTLALLLCAGVGSRMGTGVTKQQRMLCGRTVLFRAAAVLDAAAEIDGFLAVGREEELGFIASELSGMKKYLGTAIGGKTRQESAKNGLDALLSRGFVFDFLAVHDAARCLLSPSVVDAVVAAAKVSGAASAVGRISDTVKITDDAGQIYASEDRTRLYTAQTPQVFEKNLYLQALSHAGTLGAAVTDDNSLVELLGRTVTPVVTEEENLKITTRQDFDYAEYLLSKREKNMKECRIGHGYDVHRLVPDRKLILGGVEVPHTCGLLGHSDADVLLHAVMDALLGAAALGDIGAHFPDSDPAYLGADSMVLLSAVRDLLSARGAEVVNIDATVVAEKPKLAVFIPKMRENIAAALGIEPGRVSVKATTEEHLGFTGREEGIAAHAVAMLRM